jgi:hypothetical protein
MMASLVIVKYGPAMKAIYLVSLKFSFVKNNHR